jgi:hypothetical protein
MFHSHLIPFTLHVLLTDHASLHSVLLFAHQHACTLSGFTEQKDQGMVGSKGGSGFSQRSQLWETKIDWLFGTVDCHVLYIIIVTHRGTNICHSKSSHAVSLIPPVCPLW